MVVVVMIDTGLQGGIDLTVPQDVDSAQGQHMGMVLRNAAALVWQSSLLAEPSPRHGGCGWHINFVKIAKK